METFANWNYYWILFFLNHWDVFALFKVVWQQFISELNKFITFQRQVSSECCNPNFKNFFLFHQVIQQNRRGRFWDTVVIFTGSQKCETYCNHVSSECCNPNFKNCFLFNQVIQQNRRGAFETRWSSSLGVKNAKLTAVVLKWERQQPREDQASWMHCAWMNLCAARAQKQSPTPLNITAWSSLWFQNARELTRLRVRWPSRTNTARIKECLFTRQVHRSVALVTGEVNKWQKQNTIACSFDRC